MDSVISLSSSSNQEPIRNGDRPVQEVIVFPILIWPILRKIQRKNSDAAINLYQALTEAESVNPGFLLKFCETILSFNLIDQSINMIESLLQLQSTIFYSNEIKCRRKEQSFQQLNHDANLFKQTLGQLSYKTNDRELYKKIGKNAQKFIDSINEIEVNNLLTNEKNLFAFQMVKKAIIHDFKYSFNESLKNYCKTKEKKSLLESVAKLIHSINTLMETI